MDDAINAISFLMVIVERSFVLNIHKDQHAASDADSESKDIDSGITFLLQQVSPADDNVTLKHDVRVCVICSFNGSYDASPEK